MSEIVLVNPPSDWLVSDTDIMPLGILYVMADARNDGMDVVLCDLAGLEEKDWKIPVGDVYGISGTSPQLPAMKKVAKILRHRQPDCTIVIGGVHARVAPDHCREHLPEADSICSGEAETIFWYSPRTFFRTGYETTLDEFVPMPAWDSIDFYRYAKTKTYKYLLGDRTEAQIITSRGCPYKCAFCAADRLWGGKVRYHSPTRVQKEVEFLRDEFGADLIQLVDDTATLTPKRTHELCDALAKTGVPWHCLTRVDKADEAMFREMKNAGCVGVTFGFESGSDRVLRLMKKQATWQQGMQAARDAKAAGLAIRGQLMVGFPGEAEPDIEDTEDFILETPQVDTWGVHVFQPIPGSDVWEHPEEYGVTVDKDSDCGWAKTIGRPGDKLTDDPVVQERFDRIRQVIGERNIEKMGMLES